MIGQKIKLINKTNHNPDSVQRHSPGDSRCKLECHPSA